MNPRKTLVISLETKLQVINSEWNVARGAVIYVAVNIDIVPVYGM